MPKFRNTLFSSDTLALSLRLLCLSTSGAVLYCYFSLLAQLAKGSHGPRCLRICARISRSSSDLNKQVFVSRRSFASSGILFMFCHALGTDVNAFICAEDE